MKVLRACAFISGVALLCVWPITVIAAALLAPFVVATYFCFLFYNMLMAAEGDIGTFCKLVFIVLGELWFWISNVKLVASAAWYYYFTARGDGVAKNIPYFRTSYPGCCSATQEYRLDVYGQKEGGHDVVIFVHGGTWCAGSKMQYAMLAAKIRSSCCAVVVVPDYPLYPCGTIGTMLDALHYCITWVHRNIDNFGGNARIWLVGHSAGAHLASLFFVRRALALSNPSRAGNAIPEECCIKGEIQHPLPLFTRWNAPVELPPFCTSDLRLCPELHGVILLSGVYDLLYHLRTEKRRGINRLSALSAVHGGHWEMHSPTSLLNSLHLSSHGADGENSTSSEIALDVRKLPRFITIVHSAEDATVEVRQSMSFRDALVRHGAPCSNLKLVSCSHSGMVVDPAVRKGAHPVISIIDSALHQF